MSPRGVRADDPRVPPFWGEDRLWEQQAACRDALELFFPTTSEIGGREGQRQAKALCASCPVLAECRRAIDLVEAGEPASSWAGIWAGETASERRRRRAIRVSVT